jgi:hypothetical protein
MTTTMLHRMQDERLAAGVTLAIAALALAFANFGGSGDNGGAGAYAITLGLTAVVAAVLFGRVLPTTAAPARAAWILAALAIVTCVLFWSGLPFVLGIGAIYSASRAGTAGPAALGAFAVALAFVGCVVG